MKNILKLAALAAILALGQFGLQPAAAGEQKAVLVTGASTGIGRNMTERLAKEGYFVYAGARKDADLAELDAIENVDSIRLDVTKPEDIAAAVQAVRSAGRGLHGLVNNAGVTADGLLMRMSEADWDLVLAVNLKGAFVCTKAVARQMMKQRHGKIVNIASVVGIFGNAGQANYAASKAGLVGMSKALAYEVASRGITVNAVAPGFITTAMTDKLTEDQKTAILAQVPAGRMGEPAEIAAAVLYLASEEAGYVTGTTLHINGGMAMI